VRVLYNVADAWLPPGPDARGGGDVDVLPALERRLDGPPARWAIELTLLAIEWEPRLRLRSRHGFAWQSRAERRALLAAWEASPVRMRRRAAARLRALVEAAFADALRTPVASGEPQSRDGA
jgi:hypothetical protein